MNVRILYFPCRSGCNRTKPALNPIVLLVSERSGSRSSSGDFIPGERRTRIDYPPEFWLWYHIVTRRKWQNRHRASELDGSTRDAYSSVISSRDGGAGTGGHRFAVETRGPLLLVRGRGVVVETRKGSFEEQLAIPEVGRWACGHRVAYGEGERGERWIVGVGRMEATRGELWRGIGDKEVSDGEADRTAPGS